MVDVIRSTPHEVEFTTQREFSPADVSDLVGESDLIARVLVTGADSRLSANERTIETDYAVQILEAYFADRTVTSQIVTVSRPGGVLTIEARSVSCYEPDFPAFQVGEEYVLFLRRNPPHSSYIIPHGAQGAFLNVAGHAEQVSRFDGKIKNERGNLPLPDFAQEIRDLAAER